MDRTRSTESAVREGRPNPEARTRLAPWLFPKSSTPLQINAVEEDCNIQDQLLKIRIFHTFTSHCYGQDNVSQIPCAKKCYQTRKSSSSSSSTSNTSTSTGTSLSHTLATRRGALATMVARAYRPPFFLPCHGRRPVHS